MRQFAMFLALGMLSIGSTAWAAENSGAPGASSNAPGRMQGSPNAAGFGKSDTTGPGASRIAPGQEMQKDGRMQGSPNAAGFKGGGSSSSGGSGSR
ncbi:hypothetical protein FV232_10760 [Methylobacterium sp. WL30]|nr:hypothetical protein FV223_03685 [Methylobacterium sp. WL116]TXN40805.1 hypothetical protein FV225_04710 [Methylobacterium sp. WL93]TXN50739.1 hypothetical protein FV227_10765 [Methylobacterium sp. WL119]TXN67844.1 hypothetical protein FV232_10760 [Methylobacterium sp. WL30]